MEQHYIVIFGINGKSAYKCYTMCIIIPEYPGTPYELLQEISKIIENNSRSMCKQYIAAENVAIKSLTLVYQKEIK